MHTEGSQGLLCGQPHGLGTGSGRILKVSGNDGTGLLGGGALMKHKAHLSYVKIDKLRLREVGKLQKKNLPKVTQKSL